MKFSKVIKVLKAKLKDSHSISYQEFEIILNSLEDDKRNILVGMFKTTPSLTLDLISDLCHYCYSMGVAVAYKDILEVLEEGERRERKGNINRLLSQLRDNGVTFCNQGYSPYFGKDLYSISGIDEEVNI